MIKYELDNRLLAESCKDLEPLLAKRPPFLFLDRDGTLVPIAENPKDAILGAATSKVLRRLSARLSKRVAIVSARGLNMLAAEFDCDEFILAGNYGLEIRFPSGKEIVHPEAQKALSLLSEVRFDLGQMAERNARLMLDDHQYSFCLHFHKVPSEEWPVIYRQINELEQKYCSLRFRALPTSYEIVPDIEWSKASALDKIVEELSLSAEEFLCMAFGDSAADEPMFQWVNGHGGLSFNVGGRASANATSSFESSSDVIEFLRALLVLK